MPEPILIIMAAGIGSRFGGFKQMTPFGAHGEGLIHYTLYDAMTAGFKRALLVVNQAILEDFRAFLGRGPEHRMDIRYAFQEIGMLPPGYAPPPERKKPWGTGHAVLCCREAVDAPFCVINGDDLYGRDALTKIRGFLSEEAVLGRYAMVGYPLSHTLSPGGFVSRGQCFTDGKGSLTRVIERTRIIATTDGPLYTLDRQTYHRLPEDALASMNLWGFAQDFLEKLESRFPAFLDRALREDPLRAEYYLPDVVGGLLAEGEVSVKVLDTDDRWYGVTNPSDRDTVEAALADMTRRGHYPERLWPE